MNLKPFVHGLAAVVGAGGARFLAVGEGQKQISEFGVAVSLDKLGHVVAPASAARLANDPERRPANIEKGERVITRHGFDHFANWRLNCLVSGCGLKGPLRHRSRLDARGGGGVV
jgi:hypothetical protein